MYIDNNNNKNDIAYSYSYVSSYGTRKTEEKSQLS